MLDLDTLNSTSEEVFEDMDTTVEEIQVTTGMSTLGMFSSWECGVPLGLKWCFLQIFNGCILSCPKIFSLGCAEEIKG